MLYEILLNLYDASMAMARLFTTLGSHAGACGSQCFVVVRRNGQSHILRTRH